MTICRRLQIVNVIMYKRDNRYICRFMFFDDVYVMISAHQIVALIFKHVLILFLTIIDYIYDFNSIILFYIISFFIFNFIHYFFHFSLLCIINKFRNLHYNFSFQIVCAMQI